MTKHEMLQSIEWRLKEITIQLDNFGDIPLANTQNVVDECRDMAISAHRLALQILQDKNPIGPWADTEVNDLEPSDE